MPYNYEEQKKGAVRYRDNIDLNEAKTKTIDMIPGESSFMTGFLSAPENRAWLGSKFFGEKGLLDEEAVGKLYDAKLKVSDLFLFDNATPEELWGEKYKNVTDPGEKELLYMGEIYKKTVKMDSEVKIYPFSEEGILKEENPMVCLESKEKMNALAQETAKYQAVSKCNALELRGAIDDVAIKSKKEKENENEMMPGMAADESKKQEDRIVKKGNNLLKRYLNGDVNLTREELNKELDDLVFEAETYLKYRTMSRPGVKTDVEKSVSNLNNVTQEVAAKEKESQDNLKSDLMVDETGKTFSDASRAEKENFCKDLEEKGIVDEHDPVQAEKEYVQSELENVNANELVGKAAEKSAGENGPKKNAANAGDFILGRFDDNVNRGVEPDAYDLARVKNFDANMDYLEKNKSFQTMMDQNGLQYTKERWPEVEKQSDAIREKFRKENVEFEEAEKNPELKTEEERDFSEKVEIAFDKIDNGTEEEKSAALNEVAKEAVDIAGEMKDNSGELEYNLDKGNLGAAMDNAGKLWEHGKNVLKAAVHNSGDIIKNYMEYTADPEGYAKKFENVEPEDATKEKLDNRLGAEAGQHGKQEKEALDEAVEADKERKAEEPEEEAENKRKPTEREYIEGNDPDDLDGQYERYSERAVNRLIADDPDFGRKLADAMAVEELDKKDREPEKDLEAEKKAEKELEEEVQKDKEPARENEAEKEEKAKKEREEAREEEAETDKEADQDRAPGEKEEKERETEKDREKEIDKEAANEAGPERRTSLREARREGLIKYQAREKLAINKLKDMPEGYEKDGRMNIDKMQCLTQLVSSEYIKQHPGQFKDVNDMNRFTQKCFANPDLQAALLRMAEEKTGQEIMDLVKEKKLGNALKEAVEENKKNPDGEKEQKYYNDARQIKVPRYRMDPNAKTYEEEKEDEKSKDKTRKDPESEKEKEEKDKEIERTKKRPENRKEKEQNTEQEKKNEKEQDEIYEKVRKGGAKVFKEKKALEGEKKEKSLATLQTGQSGNSLTDYFVKKHSEQERERREYVYAGGRLVKKPKNAEDEKTIKAREVRKAREEKQKEREAALENLTEEQRDGLEKHTARGSIAAEKLSTMPKGYKQDGKINQEKIKCMAQYVASEYIKQNPEKFKDVDDMNRFMKDFYANDNVKAALLNVAKDHSGQEIINLVNDKKFAKVFDEALEKSKKKPTSAEERREKRTLMQDAEKLRAPVTKEDIEEHQQKKMLQMMAKAGGKAM